MNRKAVIDIGSNSVKFFVGELQEDGSIKRILDTNDVARLGEGLDKTGMLNPEPVRRNLQAVASFADMARELGADEIAAVGTMALRNASNSDEFVNAVKNACGLDLRIIPGEEEARLSYLAVLSGMPPGEDEDIVLFDTGGGSTEFIYGRGSELIKRFSVNVGAVRITENYLSEDPVSPDGVKAAIAQIDSEFAAAGVEGRPSRLVGMGGGVTTMSAVKHRMNVYDADVIQGSVLTRTDILQQMEDYAGRTLAQRIEMPGLQPKRADVILAAACILNVITERLGCEQLTVSDRGLRHGLAYELFHGTEQRK